MVTIYTLSYKDTNTPFYVGATMCSLKKRFAEHSCFNLPYLKIKRENVIIEGIEVCKQDDARNIEFFWICQLKEWGFKLTNNIVKSPHYPIKFKKRHRR